MISSIQVQKLRKMLLLPLASPQSRERIEAILKRINERSCEYQSAACANDNHAKARAKSNPHRATPTEG